MTKRDYSKEGTIRLRTEDDAPDPTKKFYDQSKYIIEYLDEVLTPEKFRVKYCPMLKLTTMLYYVARHMKDTTAYTPAEIITRYNGKYDPIHDPPTYITLPAKVAGYSKSTAKAKAVRDRKNRRNINNGKRLIL